MSLFDSASLVVTPNGYKAGKLYSIKPTSGAGDLDVVRATSATRVNASGLIESVGNNIPRLDYTNASCPSILVEPQRTNLLTNSDGNLSTYTTNSNVTDATTPINGFANSIQFGDNSLNRLAYKRNFTPTIGVEYTMSFFIQMDDNSLPVLGTTDSTGDFGLIMNGSLATINPKIEQLGTTNIYRVSASRVANNTNTQFGVLKYTTQSVKGFKVTGYQLEAGANATSYIPTVASTVTRNADVISKTGISSLIGQTEGTIYIEGSISNFANAGIFLSISDATTSNRVQIYKFTDSRIYSDRISTTQSALTSINTSPLSVGIYKVAFAYSSGNSALFVNGVQVGSTATQTFAFGAMSKIDIGSRFDNTQILNDRIRAAAIYTSRLSNAELAQLTTL